MILIILKNIIKIAIIIFIIRIRIKFRKKKIRNRILRKIRLILNLFSFFIIL